MGLESLSVYSRFRERVANFDRYLIGVPFRRDGEGSRSYDPVEHGVSPAIEADSVSREVKGINS